MLGCTLYADATPCGVLGALQNEMVNAMKAQLEAQEARIAKLLHAQEARVMRNIEQLLLAGEPRQQRTVAEEAEEIEGKPWEHRHE